MFVYYFESSDLEKKEKQRNTIWRNTMTKIVAVAMYIKHFKGRTYVRVRA